jgi:acyl-CoA thioesterase I
MLEAVGNRRFFFIVAASLIGGCVIASCGRTSTPQSEQRTEQPSSSAQAPASPERDTRPIIVAFGDSLTAGVAGRSYPENLQDLLDQNGYKYRVDNQGVSGDTTTDGLARIDNVIAEHPVLAILEFGGNDGLRGIPVQSTKKNLEEMIGRLKQSGIPLVLLGITLPPNYGPEYVKPFTDMFSELAQEHHLKFMPFLLVNVYRHPEMMQPDGIHPNGKGNEVVARDVFRLIEPFLVRVQR